MELITGVAVKTFGYCVVGFQILSVVEIQMKVSQLSQFYEIAIASARFLASCTARVSVHNERSFGRI
ncbi:hypothetical protein N0Y54_17985 [Nostoc punctiforme UO1]|uniref:hypothetical protein n=1 Tax=Nostoc punctiforme TaxID=272131 RepID=UPI0030B5DA1B